MSEPGLVNKGATVAPESPESWNSASPDPLTGDAVRRAGGAGFATAAPVGTGVWRDDITPGQTLFYRVPVDWGQQLYAAAELGSSGGGSSGGGRYVSSALVMSLYNPARGYVDDEGLLYDGRQTSAALDPLPPVAYANRYGAGDRASGMRFAGSYYLVVHLGEQVTERFGAGPYGLTLRVQVTGTAQDAPGVPGAVRAPGHVRGHGPGPGGCRRVDGRHGSGRERRCGERRERWRGDGDAAACGWSR